MKKLLLALLVVPTISFSQDFREIPLNVVCGRISDVIDVVKKAGEVAHTALKTEKSNVVLTVNPKTQDWTLIEIQGSVACVLQVGKGISFNEQKTKTY